MRRFTCNDLFNFNSVNLDYFTETVILSSQQSELKDVPSVQRCDTICVLLQYNISFYLQYLAKWPEYCHMAEGPGRRAMGYIFGKAEGPGTRWHGHVTAVTVSPDYRWGTTLYPNIFIKFWAYSSFPIGVLMLCTRVQHSR